MEKIMSKVPENLCSIFRNRNRKTFERSRHAKAPRILQFDHAPRSKNGIGREPKILSSKQNGRTSAFRFVRLNNGNTVNPR